MDYLIRTLNRMIDQDIAEEHILHRLQRMQRFARQHDLQTVISGRSLRVQTPIENGWRWQAVSTFKELKALLNY